MNLRIRLSETSQSEIIAQAEKRAQGRILEALLFVAHDDSLAKLFENCDSVYFGDCSELNEMKVARDRALADPNPQTLGALSLSASKFAGSALKTVCDGLKEEHQAAIADLLKAKACFRDASTYKGHLSNLGLTEQQEYWSSLLLLKQVPDIDADLRHAIRAMYDSFKMLEAALQSVEAVPDLIPLCVFSCRSTTNIAHTTALRFRDEANSAFADASRAASNLEHAAQLAETRRRTRSGRSSADDDTTESTNRSGGGHFVQSGMPGDDDTNTQASFGTDLDFDVGSYPEWDDPFDVNPSTGLPMIEGTNLDVSGHVFGTGIPGDGW